MNCAKQQSQPSIINCLQRQFELPFSGQHVTSYQQPTDVRRTRATLKNIRLCGRWRDARSDIGGHVTGL